MSWHPIRPLGKRSSAKCKVLELLTDESGCCSACFIRSFTADSKNTIGVGSCTANCRVRQSLPVPVLRSITSFLLVHISVTLRRTASCVRSVCFSAVCFGVTCTDGATRFGERGSDTASSMPPFLRLDILSL